MMSADAIVKMLVLLYPTDLALRFRALDRMDRNANTAAERQSIARARVILRNGV